MILFLFLSLFYSTSENVNQFKVVKCHQKDFILIKQNEKLKIISDIERVYDFPESEERFILDFYCYEDKLFFLEIKKRMIDSSNMFRLINIYEIKENKNENNKYILFKRDWITSPDEYFNINYSLKEFYNYKNRLFFYDYQTYEISEHKYFDGFDDKVVYRNYTEGVIRKILYDNNKVVLDFKKEESNNNSIYLLGKDTEKIIDTGLLIDFLSTDKDIIAYRNNNDNLVIYDSFPFEVDLPISDMAQIKLFNIENRIYFFINDNNKLSLGIIFTDESNRFKFKELNDSLYFDIVNNNIFYLKENLDKKDIYFINTKVTELEKPIIFLKGALKANPKYLEFSNLNLDPIFFESIEIELSSSSNFNPENILVKKVIEEYNDLEKQSYDISRLVSWNNDKPYYIRLRYTDIFERYSMWSNSSFIITDLGKIDSFYIESNLNSKVFTKDRIVNLIFDKTGTINELEISYDNSFKESSFYDFNNKINFTLNDNDGIHNLYARAVIRDKNDIVAYGEIKEASIELNRSNIDIPNLIYPKEQDTVKNMPFTIKWDLINGLNYNILISSDSSFNNIIKEYYFVEENKQKISFLAEGEYFLKIYAKDSSGNISREKVVNFYVENKNSSSGCGF